MKRPELNEVAMPKDPFAPGVVSITLSPEQWDALLDAAYERGWLLLEIDVIGGEERIVKAYRKP